MNIEIWCYDFKNLFIIVNLENYCISSIYNFFFCVNCLIFIFFKYVYVYSYSYKIKMLSCLRPKYSLTLTLSQVEGRGGKQSKGWGAGLPLSRSHGKRWRRWHARSWRQRSTHAFPSCSFFLISISIFLHSPNFVESNLSGAAAVQSWTLICSFLDAKSFRFRNWMTWRSAWKRWRMKLLRCERCRPRSRRKWDLFKVPPFSVLLFSLSKKMYIWNHFFLLFLIWKITLWEENAVVCSELDIFKIEISLFFFFVCVGFYNGSWLYILVIYVLISRLVLGSWW